MVSDFRCSSALHAKPGFDMILTRFDVIQRWFDMVLILFGMV